MKQQIAIAIGSNVGDPRANIQKSLEYLSAFVDDLACANLYQSAPMYETDQDVFINTVVTGYVDLKPLTLLAKLKEIEMLMGRVKTMRNGPRLIDLDVVLYGEDSIEEGSVLIVPHPRMAERPFVMVPLCELMPDYIHPVQKRTILEMKNQLDYTDHDLSKL